MMDGGRTQKGRGWEIRLSEVEQQIIQEAESWDLPEGKGTC